MQQTAAIQLSQPSLNPSPKTRIKMALAELAMFRGAKPDAATLTLYSSRLEREHPDDVITACDKIAEMPREEGRPALPELGAMLAVVQSVRAAREAKEHNERETMVIRRKCTVCNCTTSGFNKPNDQIPRYCQRRTGARGQICGGNMEVIFREPAKELFDDAA
jgi:hypothetical protein